MAVELLQPNTRTDGSGKPKNHGVENVGRISFLFSHPLLNLLATKNASKYGGIKDGVFLTGFKLESTVISADGLIDNAKLIPFLNGDTMTLTNSIKAGEIKFGVTRTAAGIEDGDIVAIADFIRSQGDADGGQLQVSWYLNGEQRSITFKKVCVKRNPPLLLAGNDIPDYGTTFTFADYDDSEYPALG